MTKSEWLPSSLILSERRPWPSQDGYSLVWFYLSVDHGQVRMATLPSDFIWASAMTKSEWLLSSLILFERRPWPSQNGYPLVWFYLSVDHGQVRMATR